jgi:peptidoglycan/xylan/chitin deacetylase (PgdA/CDA1 family)
MTARSSGRAVILCYHSVHPSLPFASATPARFAEHLDWLRHNCDVVPLGRIASAETAGAGRPLVAITFDDGYEDNYTHAFPLLRERGLAATFFVTVGLVERDAATVERFGALRQVDPLEVAPLSWDQLREMSGAGASIGAHTWSHPNLSRLGEPETRLELERPKAILEDRLGAPVTEFAYPFGKPGRHFTPATIRLVAEAGYAVGAAVLFRAVRRGDDRLALPRFFVTGDDLDTLAAKVGGAWDWLGLVQERVPERVARMVSPADFRV